MSHSTIFMLRRTGFVLMLALASACQPTTDVTHQLDVTLSTDRSTVGPSSVVAITIRIVNRGVDAFQTMPPESYACPRAFVVRDASGIPLTLPARVCTLPGYAPITLAPGDSLVLRDGWSGDVSDGRMGAVAAKPGAYSVVARVIGDGRELSSEPVAVRVVER